MSNIDILNGSQRSNSVMIYDSGTLASVSLAVKHAVCFIMRPRADTLHFDLVIILLHFDLVIIHPQPNGWECGLFAMLLLALLLTTK